jgi:hypothetical protein
MYLVQFEAPGDAAKVLGLDIASIEEVRSKVREFGRPGVYARYEKSAPTEGVFPPAPVSGPRFGMVFTSAGQLWEEQTPERHDYRRGDGWSARPSDEEARAWVYCRPDGTEAGSVGRDGPDQIAAGLAKIDELIAEAD